MLDSIAARSLAKSDQEPPQKEDEGFGGFRLENKLRKLLEEVTSPLYGELSILKSHIRLTQQDVAVLKKDINGHSFDLELLSKRLSDLADLKAQVKQLV